MDFQFNVSLGREVEFWNRVNDSDPTNAIFRCLILAAAGIEDDALMRERTTFADLLAGSDEVTNTGYSRISFTDADIGPYTVDDDAREILLALPSVITQSPSAGDSWAKIVVGYDSDSTGGTDSGIIPVTAHDLLYAGSVIIPDGSPVNIDLTGGFVVARARS